MSEGYLPSLNAFGTYNANYLNNSFGKTYSDNFPNSFAGLSLVFPIFQGGKRIQQIRQATLQVKRVDYDIVSLKDGINAAYAQALATYKGSFAFYNILKDNLAIATGHAMIGLSLGPATGKIINDVLNGSKPEMNIDVFSPGRFQW